MNPFMKAIRKKSNYSKETSREELDILKVRYGLYDVKDNRKILRNFDPTDMPKSNEPCTW